VLFNSFEFLFAFLPVVAIAWYALRQWAPLGSLWLVAASLFFYGWWDARYVPLLLGSIAVNFAIGRRLTRIADAARAKRAVAGCDAGLSPGTARPTATGTVRPTAAGAFAGRPLLIAGIAFDLGLLAWFKYADFFVANVNAIAGTGWTLPGVVLPLGISFFTFTQIAFLVDAWRGEAREYSATHYALFVTFFPHLLAGPILHHKEMMPQFALPERQRVQWDNIARGLALLVLGLAKKVLVADSLAPWADAGFAAIPQLGFADAWIATLAYTLQLYFDFSGYTDMALGMALMLNIRMPQNFDSPYATTNIRDFWRRWHMTLSRFLRDYLYVPLGGNRSGPAASAAAVMATFLLGGLWHGANWTFVAWGALNGAGLVVHRLWQRTGLALPGPLAWLVTFAFVNLCWVFFRAPSLAEAAALASTLLGANGIDATLRVEAWAWLAAEKPAGGPGLASWWSARTTALVLALALPIAVLGRTALAWAVSVRLSPAHAAGLAVLAAVAVLGLERVREFLYFNF
jgi:D-alanyl-lipoteichoic acid acyltransferase DltB (MBOAT superfamily)